MIMLLSPSSFHISLVHEASRLLQADGSTLSRKLDPVVSRYPFQPNYSVIHVAS